MKRILVATDGSDDAERATKFAADLAGAARAELSVLTVVVPDISEDLEQFRSAEHATIGDVVEAGAEACLGRARAIAERSGVRKVDLITRIGDPAHMILDVANSVGVDLIVLGKRGRGRLKGLVLGSVSQNLVANAGRAVTVVP